MFVYETSEPEITTAFAFQPIIDADSAQPTAYRLVLRGGADSGAIQYAPMIEAAIGAAAAAGIGERRAQLLLPLGTQGDMPEQLLQSLVRAAMRHRIALSSLIVSVSAGEYGDTEAAARLIAASERRGLAIALHDFAAAPAGIQLLARVSPRFLRIDATLVRAIDASSARRQILESVMRLARRAGADVIAPGIQSPAELAALHGIGIRQVEGDWIAPATARLAMPHLCDEPALGLGRAIEPRRANAAVARREIGSAHRRLQHHHRASGRPAPTAEGPVQLMPLPA
ncbi:EAL domain-containing protein [Sphingosinithalassobacter portus]|uniref:EAL domain-containing protein n=1 Tax=Stakelama portus TaxID=2676234 RepID=UPI000D6E19A7|nr:EAL domain-containing protein [Sphingosinithalassobacter portus]